MTAPLTKRQKQVLNAIAAFIKAKGYSPSYEELAKKIGVSSLAVVATYLKILQRKGYIFRNRNAVREIQILPPEVFSLRNCENGHAVCWFAGDCPACAMRGAA